MGRDLQQSSKYQAGSLIVVTAMRSSQLISRNQCSTRSRSASIVAARANSESQAGGGVCSTWGWQRGPTVNLNLMQVYQQLRDLTRKLPHLLRTVGAAPGHFKGAFKA